MRAKQRKKRSPPRTNIKRSITIEYSGLSTIPHKQQLCSLSRSVRKDGKRDKTNHKFGGKWVRGKRRDVQAGVSSNLLHVYAVVDWTDLWQTRKREWMAVRPAKNARVVWPDRALTFRLPFPLLHISSLTFSQHSIPFYTLQSIQQIIPCTTQRSSNASSLVTLVGTRAQKSKKNCPLLTCMLCAVCV